MENSDTKSKKIPKVSVIVPVCNAGAGLQRTLESLSAQRLDEFEVICIDNASTDDSAAILQRHAARDPRLRIITCTTPGSRGGARNAGMLAARGHYLFFVNPGDVIDSNCCRWLYDAADRFKADMACCSLRRERPSRASWAVHYTEERWCADLASRYEAANCPPVVDVVNKIFRRSWIKRWRYQFPDRSDYEDVVFVMRALATANRLVVVPEILYCQADRGEPAGRHRRREMEQARYEALHDFVRFADRAGVPLTSDQRLILVRSYRLFGWKLLTEKEFGPYRAWYLFDFIPIWRTV